MAYRMLHYALESYGLRVSDGDRTLAYSADSAPCEGLIELARDADLFLCEATLSQPEQGIRGHLTAGEAIDAYKSSGADRLVVIHRPDELPLPDGVERAFDGLELDV
jgi:ribonuclease BN (tRNA processing enzyme)